MPRELWLAASIASIVLVSAYFALMYGDAPGAAVDQDQLTVSLD